jgi:hypothetical protein
MKTAMSSLTPVLPRILSFLFKGEDYISASQVSRSWRAASHVAKPQRLVIDTCFGSDKDSLSDDSYSSDSLDDHTRRLHKLWYWFKLKIDSGNMAELRDVTLNLDDTEEHDMAWCLILKDLEISHLKVAAHTVSRYHHLLPKTIKHLHVSAYEAWLTCKVCASKLRRLTRLTDLNVLSPFLLDCPLRVEKLLVGKSLTVAKDNCLNTLLPNIRQVDLTIPASLEGQELGDRILELSSLTKANFNLCAHQHSAGQSRIKFQCPEKVECTVSKPPQCLLDVFVSEGMQHEI